jgi:hypothetical protein
MENKMNERIRELADLAKKKPLGNSWCYTNPAEFEQKFAELIVRECIEVVGDCSIEYATRPQIMEEIKEHFGVE